MIPKDLKYSKEHEWVKAEGKTAIIGITHYAQDSLGDIVYAELPPSGKALKAMEEMGVVESVKSVSSLFCPVSCKVVEVNEEAKSSPQVINQDPYGKGWLIKVELNDPKELDNLLSAEDYKKHTESK